MIPTIDFVPSVVNININIPWTAIAGGFIGYALWSKIAKIAGERIPFLDRAAPLIGTIGAISGMFAGPIVALVSLVALVVITIWHKKAQGEELLPFLTDMVREAREAPERPFVGTEQYIFPIEMVIGRDEKNNAVLVGPAGVGKSVIVEDIASRIAFGRLAAGSPLANKRIIRLDIRKMLAGPDWAEGALPVGTMESRVRDLLNFCEKNEDVILFMDEIHMMQGAGAGSLRRGRSVDLSNLLKDALARNEISLIGATTQQEYNNTIARDAALERRFEVVHVASPSIQACVQMIKAQKPYFAAKYAGVTLSDAAIKAAVIFAGQNFPERQILDIAMDLIHNAHTLARRLLQENPDAPVGGIDLDPTHIAATCAMKLRTHPHIRRRKSFEMLMAHWTALNLHAPNLFGV